MSNKPIRNQVNKKYYHLSVNYFVMIGDVILALIKNSIKHIISLLKLIPQIIFRRKEKPRVPANHLLLKFLLAFFAGVVASIIFITVPFTVYRWFKELPTPDLLLAKQPNSPTRILDNKGRLLFEIYVDQRVEPVTLNSLPDYVVQATLAVEDDRFFEHRGIRLDSILRSLKAIIIDNELQGGSTITQQLVKNMLLTNDRTVARKTKEVVLSLLVEQKYTKEQILELYMNNIPYGGSAWGIQSASKKFFNKDAKNLTLAEASMLAGLPSSPTLYSPLVTDSNSTTSLAKIRQNTVLQQMVINKNITQELATDAYNEELTFAPQNAYIRAPHFVEIVKAELLDLYGERYLTTGGLTVTTTLDLDLQDEVQQIISTDVDTIGKAKGFTNAGALILKSQTAEVLAYVGSKNYFDGIEGAYDVVQAYRQPGSSIKIVTYALALEGGATPATIVPDTPFTLRYDNQVYTPKNYDGKFHGANVTLRQAFANSYNIPPVRLIQRFGVDNMISLGGKLGLRNWIVDGSYGPSATLGGKEVTLLDLTNLYATFSRGGLYVTPKFILSVRDNAGYEVYKNTGIEKRLLASKAPTDEKQIISKSTAYLVSNILADNAARTPIFGANSVINVKDHTVAAKTGTTDNNRDGWTFGYTPSYTVGVWTGNNDNKPMNSTTSGVSSAGPMWNKVISKVLEDVPNENFEVPTDVVLRKYTKCNISEYFVKGSAPKDVCPSEEHIDKK